MLGLKHPRTRPSKHPPTHSRRVSLHQGKNVAWSADLDALQRGHDFSESWWKPELADNGIGGTFPMLHGKLNGRFELQLDFNVMRDKQT